MDVKELEDYCGIAKYDEYDESVEELKTLLPEFKDKVRCGFELEGNWGESLYDVKVGKRTETVYSLDQLHAFIEDAAGSQGGLFDTLSYVYEDGSVDTELVTQPLRVDEILPSLRLWMNVLSDCGVAVDSYEGAGCHMTVSAGVGMPLYVKANVEQIVRYFAPALLYFACDQDMSRRDPDYYELNGSPIIRLSENRTLNGITYKYSTVHFKTFGRVSGFEFRYPDPTEPTRLYAVAVLNMAILLKAIKITIKHGGVFKIKNKRMRMNNRVYGRFVNRIDISDYRDLITIMAGELIEFLADEIEEISGLNVKRWRDYTER
ncbi:MAG: hypothetical protein DRJ03_08010 [Chloroflexi bacterium]|nr:MAG: hypothetical protein DRJ03_08010 [Chloroflexota bacterium]